MIVSGIPESEVLASAVWSVAARESQLCQLALMWLLTNRRRVSGGASLIDVCGELRDVEGAPDCETADTNDSEVYGRLVEMARSVLLRESVDPTCGAWRFHRHSECPVWSHGLAPTALIGPFLFYAPPVRSGEASMAELGVHA